MLEMLIIIWIILVVHVEVAISVLGIVFPSRVVPSTPIVLAIVIFTALALFALLLLGAFCVVVMHMTGAMSKVISVHMEMFTVLLLVR